MFKPFLFILPFLINTSTCIIRVALDISRKDDPNFTIETSLVDGNPTLYIIPRAGVFTTSVYDGNDLIWERIHERQLLGYVRLTAGPNGNMVINSRVPGERKLLDYFKYSENKWVRFKSFDSKIAREARLKASLEKKKLELKEEFSEESFTGVDFEELDESYISNKEQEPSSSSKTNQHQKDLEEDPEFFEEFELSVLKFDEQFEKDIDQKKDDESKPDDDQDKPKQEDQELVSEDKDGFKSKTTEKSNGLEEDDASFKTCDEFILETSVCDECGFDEGSQVCLVGRRSRWPSSKESHHEDGSEKSKECEDTELVAVGGKVVDPGDSISAILAAMTDNDDDDAEISSLIVGGPESDVSRRPSTFEAHKVEEGYVGFSTFDDNRILELIPDGNFGFKMRESVNPDTEEKKPSITTHSSGEPDDEEEEEQEDQEDVEDKEPRKTGPLRFIRKEIKKKPSKRPGDLKMGFVSSLRKPFEEKQRSHSQDISDYALTKPTDQTLGKSLKRQGKNVPKSPIRGHSESDISLLLKERKPLDEFRQKSETDVRRQDALAPGASSAPSTLQRPKKGLRSRIPLITRSYSTLTKDSLKKSKHKSKSSSFLTHFVKEGLKKGKEEIDKRKAKKESLKQQKKDLESKPDYDQKLDSQEAQTEQTVEDTIPTDSDKSDIKGGDIVTETEEEKVQVQTQLDQKEDNKETEQEETRETGTSRIFTECDLSDKPVDSEKSSKQHKDDPDEEKKDQEGDPSNPYDKALYELIGARPKTKMSFKIKHKRSGSKEKFKIPKIVVQDPEGNVVDTKIDVPKKKDRKNKKDKDKKTGRDKVEELANDEFIIRRGVRRFSSKDKKQDKKEDDDGSDPNGKCKPTKTNVKWDDEDDDEDKVRREEVSKKFLRQTSSCCAIS